MRLKTSKNRPGVSGMKRIAYEELLRWKQKKDRKPLIMYGARQVGKTWLLKEFGANEYQNVAYLNFDSTSEAKDLFIDYDTARLIRAFSALTGVSIQPGETLVILDEIQEAPAALTALKYFCEEAPEYHIVAAGSLLGIEIHSGTGFPVGKVDEIHLYPLSFEEFLMAFGKNVLVQQLKEHQWNQLQAITRVYMEVLRQYYYVGGMPEVVKEYVAGQDFTSTRKVQKQILADYHRDFSKHIPADLLPKVRLVWDSLAAQLAKENKKFIYGVLKKGARAKDFENAIEWLSNAGLVHKVNRVSKVEKPLKFYEDSAAFKLYCLDLGLLGAMVDMSAKDVIVKNDAFTEYKGAFTEQYVFQEMLAHGIHPYYYSKENSTLEIDFLFQKDCLYMVEVKAEENLRSKSLKTLHEANVSAKAMRFSMADYRVQEWLTNVPLSFVGEWIEQLK